MAYTRIPDRRDALLKQMLQLRARSQARREAPVSTEDALLEDDYSRYRAQLAPEDFEQQLDEEIASTAPAAGPAARGMITEGPGSPQQPFARYSKQMSSTYPGGSAFVEGMVKRGWTPEEAAGAAGNVHVESGFQPGIKSKAPGENSFGFLQWNKERLAGLQNMATQTGRDWKDPETQMDWIDMERSGKSVSYGGGDERSSYAKAFRGGGTPAEIAERFGRFVERPQDLNQSVEQRRQAAANYAASNRRFGLTSEEGMSVEDEVRRIVMGTG